MRCTWNDGRQFLKCILGKKRWRRNKLIFNLGAGRKRNEVNAKKDGNKRNHLSEIFKNGNVLKLIRNVSSCLLSMKDREAHCVIFFSTFLCSYTFSLGKKNTSRHIQQSVLMRPLSSKSRRRASWGRWCQSSSVLGAAAPKPGLAHQWRIRANETWFWFSSTRLHFSSYCPLRKRALSEFCLILVFGVEHVVGTAGVHTLELLRISCGIFLRGGKERSRCSRRSLA